MQSRSLFAGLLRPTRLKQALMQTDCFEQEPSVAIITSRNTDTVKTICTQIRQQTIYHVTVIKNTKQKKPLSPVCSHMAASRGLVPYKNYD